MMNKTQNSSASRTCQVEYKPFYIKVPSTYAGVRIDTALSIIIPEVSRNVITNWLRAGQIHINNQTPKPKTKLKGGEDVLVVPSPPKDQLAFKPEPVPLEVIYEDEHIIVINKRAGLTVHPGNGNWSGTLLNGLLFYYPELANIARAGIVHRLDKDTTGTMVVARNKLAQLNLIKQLQQHSVYRVYRAIVEGNTCDSGTINKNIGRDSHNRIKMTTLNIGGKNATTHYKTLLHLGNFSYLQCELETGRTHQIRVHLKSIGHPIVADPVYGNNKLECPPNILQSLKLLNRQALHAIQLRLTHPSTQQTMNFYAPLPSDIDNLLTQLKLYDNAHNYYKT